MSFFRSNLRQVGALLAACGSSLASADSLIGLELIGPPGPVDVGQTFGVKLRAKQEPNGKFTIVGDKFIAIDCILQWDPTKLKLMGLSTAGSVSLLSSYFPTPAGDYTGINEVVPPQDGNALYYALAPLGAPVSVPTTGVQIVTFNFRVESAFDSATISILDSLTVLEPADSVVYDGTVPGLDVTGTLSGAKITRPAPCAGDLNGSGGVDGADMALLLNNWGNPGVGDLDLSGAVTATDLAILINDWGACPGS